MAYIASIPEPEESVAAVLGRYPKQVQPLMALVDELLRSGECAFSHQQRELIGAYASGVNACTYCYETHRASAEAFGVEPGLLQAALDDLDASPVAANLKPVLRLVRKLTLTPSRMSQSDADAVLAAGWSENDFHYAVMICSLFNMMNRIMDGYGVRNTADFRSEAGRRLAEAGYGAR